MFNVSKLLFLTVCRSLLFYPQCRSKVERARAQPVRTPGFKSAQPAAGIVSKSFNLSGLNSFPFTAGIITAPQLFTTVTPGRL